MGVKHVAAAAAAGLAVVALAGCSSSTSASSAASTTPAMTINVVAAENEYADVVSQIGGSAVNVTAIMSDPNTDPHTYEADASVAQKIADAQVLVENGLGYDDFMDKLASASPNADRQVISAQDVLGLPDSTDNPHLWYDPKTMPAVASKIADTLSTLDPADASTFRANLTTFTDSLAPWTQAMSALKSAHPDTPVAVTEPVADYMLQAAGTDIKTPWDLQAAIMNDTDPAPQDSATQEALFAGKAVKVFLYNQQVTDDTTTHYLSLAQQNGIPVVGVYETMPTGYHYQDWMLAEVNALDAAITSGTSTETLQK